MTTVKQDPNAEIIDLEELVLLRREVTKL
jgi:hypothetical protein